MLDASYPKQPWTDDDDATVLAWLETGSGLYSEYRLTEQNMALHLGIVLTETILSKMEAYAVSGSDINNRVVARFLRHMGPGGLGLNIGFAETRGMLEMFVAGGLLTRTEVDAVKGLASERPNWKVPGVLPPRLSHIQAARVL